MVFCLILFSIIAFSGCATLKKGRLPKLIRGQKTKDIEETEETAKGMISCHRIYRNAYILWQACQEELIKKLGSNKKKDILLRERVIQNLERMQSCLLREKRDLFKGQIERFKELTEDLNTRRLNISQSRRLKRELYNQKRQIQREFSYKKMGGWIKPDK
ncbi:MAG: hypothetical protein U9Q08_02365 [Candidatus Omnitrophota bacterium]|nr:hypothetical protein [Candidatus Omnitrophota bacterium]